jgi:ubiquinone/menaquinone biosynthesis C-methylase UbiE
MLGASVVGIDVMPKADASIDYRRYDGAHIPLTNDSVDAVLLCYVLHHAQNASLLLSEIKRVLKPSGLVVIYEDIPETLWDRFLCWTHNLKWRRRTGTCRFRSNDEWRALFTEVGLNVMSQRRLSRWRNLTHPVVRQFCQLTNHEISGGSLAGNAEGELYGSGLKS